jgi:hypothetical protein
VRRFLLGLRDLLRGLFTFPGRGGAAGADAAAIEERYRRPSRCC